MQQRLHNSKDKSVAKERGESIKKEITRMLFLVKTHLLNYVDLWSFQGKNY